MMNVSRIHERLSGKLNSFLILIKRIFRLPLRFRANSHSDVTSVRHDNGRKYLRQERESNEHKFAALGQKQILNDL